MSTKAKAWGAAGLAAAVAAGVTVPLVLGSGHGSLTKAFERSLLTPQQVSTLTDETFAVDTSSDNSGDNSSSGCLDAMNSLTNGNDRGEASISLASADSSSYIAEDLSNDTNNTQGLNLLRTTLQTCHSASFGGVNVAIHPLPQPRVSASSDAIAFQMTASSSGRAMVFDFDIVRFGDTIVMVMCGTVDSTINLPALTGSLLTEAITKARPAIPGIQQTA